MERKRTAKRNMDRVCEQREEKNLFIHKINHFNGSLYEARTTDISITKSTKHKHGLAKYSKSF